MKRIVSLLLAVMLLAVVYVSAVPVSAATPTSANALFRWKYNGENYAEASRPEIDEVWTDGNNIVNLRFFPRKNAIDYGYRIYVKTPKQKDWRPIVDLPIQACTKDTKTGLICAKVTLTQSILTDIYHTSSVGNLSSVGVKLNNESGYYPHAYTVKALDKNGDSVGGFRGSMSNGKYATQPATLTPFKGNRTDDSFSKDVMNYSVPIIGSGCGESKSTEYTDDDWARMDKELAEYGSCQLPCTGRVHYIQVPTECKKYVKYMRLYYKNKSGGWTKYKDIPVTSSNRNLVEVTVSYRDVFVQDGHYVLAARALDKNYKWLSSFIGYPIDTLSVI